VRVTNEAQFGYIFDESTSPLGLIQVRAGALAESGDPRPWRDGQITPIRRFARAFGATRPNATEWYYPRRLRLDIDAANDLRMTPAARLLGLRLHHGRRIRLPLYAYGTALTRGRVAAGAQRLERLSRIEEVSITDDHGMSHLDPLARTAATRLPQVGRPVPAADQISLKKLMPRSSMTCSASLLSWVSSLV
jgi:hypothetical protein